MQKFELDKKFWAGLFFIIGIFIICLVILNLDKDKGFAQAKFQVTVLFKDVGGLVEGAPIRLFGVNIGNVDHIDFLDKELEGRRVRVTLNILSKYKSQLYKDTPRFSIHTEGILGDKLIEIDVVKTKERIDLRQPIMGEDGLDVQELAKVFARAAESFTKTSEDLSKINFQEVTGSMSKTAQSLSKASENLNLVLDQMQYITKKTRRLLDRIEQRLIDGNLFKVF